MPTVQRILPWFAAILLACSLGGPASVHAQVVVGVVRAEVGEEPIAEAEVALLDLEGERVQTTATDSVGRFRLEAPRAGTYRIRIAGVGYREIVSDAIELGPVEQVDVEVYLSIDAVPLDPIVVTERRRYPNLRIQGFYERAEWVQRSGFGRILTKDDLARIRPHSMRMLLATQPMGFRAGARCQPRIYIDGMDLGAGAEAVELLDGTIHWEDIEGIELYRGATQIPPQYTRGNDCGAVLVWSKAGSGNPFSWRRLAVAAGILLLMFSF